MYPVFYNSPKIKTASSAVRNLLAALLLALVGSSATLQAENNSLWNHKDLLLVPSNHSNPVKITLSMDKTTPKIGEKVKFAVKVSRKGYLTLWDISTSGKVKRLFPWQKNNRGIRVKAGKTYQIGKQKDDYHFLVQGPRGVEDIYAIWSSTPDAQPTGSSFSSAGLLGKDLIAVQKRHRIGKKQWQSKKLSFEIIDPEHDYQQALSQQLDIHIHLQYRRSIPAASRVFVLSVGANTGALQKANQDARLFGRFWKKLLRVPEQQVRILNNATVADFRSGLQWLKQEVRKQDRVFVFFSGHGSTVADDNGDEFDGMDEGFVMFDAHSARYPGRRHMLVDDEYAQSINALASNRVISIIDACHAGGLNKNLETAFVHGRSKFFSGGKLGLYLEKRQNLAQRDMAAGMDGLAIPGKAAKLKMQGLILAATAENLEAMEQTDKGGLFVDTLLAQIKKAKSGSSLLDVFDATRKIISQRTAQKQIPVSVGDKKLAQTLVLGQE